MTVHYTAGPSAGSAIQALKKRGLNYHLIIERDGTVIQSAWLTHSVFHAGAASWAGISPNRWHIAVALVSWGKVTAKGVTWNGTAVPMNEIVAQGKHFWHKATPEQEARLIEIGSWLVQRGLSSADFCGHHECCIPIGRKLDPGGILSFTMTEFRQRLQPL